MTASAERRDAALHRFASFFQELRGVFVEREDVITQMALALLAKEHVLITGPPGTGKSKLVSSVVGRVVHAETGQPSLFAKQFTESTVQTELIGAIDFRTLTETGRTEHFTDEGMLGAVHAFLDEVLDGRDMLLRSTLNILEERELKQGTKITPGRIECAVMTSNRYLTEVIEESRRTLLAFVDRIAFVSFIPRGFAQAVHLEKVVANTLAGRLRLDQRLTIEDVDVLQEMARQVVIPPHVSRAVVELARAFEARAGQLERSDPTFTATRYFSTRAFIRLAELLGPIVVLDRATARPGRALVAALDDLGLLRLAMMLAGPRIDDVEHMLAHESDPRERRQLTIMQAELEIFRECLREMKSEPPAEAADAADVADASSAAKLEPGVTSETEAKPDAGSLLDGRLAAAVMALTVRPGDVSAIEAVSDAAAAFEVERPDARAAAQAARGRALAALADALELGAFEANGAPTREALEEHFVAMERVAKLRETLLASEVAQLDRAAESERFSAGLVHLGRHVEAVADRLVHDAIAQSLAAREVRRLGVVLAALEPVLDVLHGLDRRLGALHGVSRVPLSDAVLGRRIAPLLRATYASLDRPPRGEVVRQVEEAMMRLERLGLAAAVPLVEHLTWIAEAFVRGEPPLVVLSGALGHEAYRALRGDEDRTPVCFAVAELIAMLLARRGSGWTPSLTALAEVAGQLPKTLHDALARIDLDRVERAASFFEAWASTDFESDARLSVCFEEKALLRFTLEARLVGELFPDHTERATAMVERLRAVATTLRAGLEATQRAEIDRRWAELNAS